MNTKYVKGQFVRNIATVLVAITAGAFWACTNEESTLGGGVSEETRVTALNNITIAGKAMMLTGVNVSEDDSLERDFNPEFTFDREDQVTVFELDSVTFEKTGVEYNSSVFDHEGSFKMDSVSFKSPYVLVKVQHVQGKCTENEVLCGENVIGAVVDLNATKDVNANVLTTLASERILKLAATGIGLDSAKRKAEREVLDAFYIFEKHTPFEELSFAAKADKSFPVFVAMNYLFGGLYAEYLSVVATDVADDGLWNDTVAVEGFGESVKTLLGYVASAELDYGYLYRTSMQEVLGLSSSDGEILALADKYLSNFGAVVNDGLELCKESNQGEISVEPYWPVKCDKGLWGPADELPHEFGSLVDERDGKVYKTVAIEINGVKQTWMAENLNYADSLLGESLCYDGDIKNCEKYGRLYTWNAAMNTTEDIVAVYESGSDGALNPQGICPDGWRLPTEADWEVLQPTKQNGARLDSVYKATAALKSKKWLAENRTMRGQDLYGFNVLPVGWCGIEYLDEEAGEAFLDGKTDEEPLKGFVCHENENYASFAVFKVKSEMLRFRSDRSDAALLQWGDEAVSVRCIKND